MQSAQSLSIVEKYGSYWIADYNDIIEGPYLTQKEAERALSEWIKIEQEESEDE